jgi:hypothetical protein
MRYKHRKQNMKRALKYLAIGAVTVAFATPDVSAITFKVEGLAPGVIGANTYWVAGDEPSPPVSLLFKEDFATGSQEGSGVGSFDVAWVPPDEDPHTAVITWTPGYSFTLTTIWLKAGSDQGNSGGGEWYSFDVSGFNLAIHDSITLVNPSGDKPAISHVSLVGSAVPEGGVTAVMLGMGLLGLGLIGRRRV